MARSNRSTKNKSRTQSRRRKTKAKSRVDPKKFWGDPEALPSVADVRVNITTNPVAVVKSLGRPPLSGQQNASEHYFTAVYERAVNLGAALAAAGDLIEAEDLAGD
ncbi:MAG: hypothetical protein OES24_18655 [Acidimicrobiia bacterium]|nr:hypothetical protein [Acidimicrobiia bacterium]